jgi:NADH dehydrogenase (ubiquinone) Fe-S protein 3
MVPILSLKIIDGKIFCVVPKKNILKVIMFLKNHVAVQLKVLTMIGATDYPHQDCRFEIVYELLSIRYNNRLKIKCFVHEVSQILSLVSIFESATWWEREIWDLFGVYFLNNPDLRRILTDYGFLGNPLKKDYPLTGFTEVYYDSVHKTVSYTFLELSQKQRFFIAYSSNLNE